MTRICSKCKKVKNLKEDFYPNKAYRGGYTAQCKTCHKAHPSQSPEKLLVRVQKTRNRNRQFLWDYYSANPCVDCGESDPVVLELDHCKGDHKIDRVSALVHNTRSLTAIQREIDKCDVVCANCHKRRTAQTQGWYAGIKRGY